MKPIIFTLMEYLEEVCPTASLKTPAIEWLNPDTLSSSVVQLDEPTVEKAYINGAKQYRVGFDIIVQAKVANKVELIKQIYGLCYLFEDMKGKELDGVQILKVDTTTPSLRAQTESMDLRYGFSATLCYRSN